MTTCVAARCPEENTDPGTKQCLISCFFLQKASLLLMGSRKAIHQDLDPIHAITSPCPTLLRGQLKMFLKSLYTCPASKQKKVCWQHVERTIVRDKTKVQPLIRMIAENSTTGPENLMLDR
ncbi:hypothetical protein O6H91_04G060000 [Diphasiastrum complanatum]|uniref:Uncharacterized protein n=1 Tax=Diphasiastrum complanatum TaxID=34168 RepID=A0ACC2DXG7_DIPCM|nr:hypothetical protein O6H91_04G060000 [Diphasiastrum complanatum]